MRAQRRWTAAWVVVLAGWAATAAAAGGGVDLAARAEEVRQAERAFAGTMADRDLAAFGQYVSQEARFFGGPEVLRGRAAVVEGWKPYFEEKQAPFSWEPEQVEVLDSGDLALSTGPVRDPQGGSLGTFSSIWRREADGHWRVIFDQGCPPCRCP